MLKEGNETHTFKRVINNSGSLIGSWKTEGSIVTFLNDGSYLFLALSGNECGETGIESGKYSATNGSLQAKTKQFDTNGCMALIDTDGSDVSLTSFKYTIVGNTATVQYETEDPVKYTRF